MQPTSFPAAYFVSFRSECLQNPEVVLSSLSIADAKKVSHFFHQSPLLSKDNNYIFIRSVTYTHFFAHMVTKQSERLELV